MVVNKSCVAACQKSVRMTVESVSGCSWNECPDQRGITVRMRVEWVSESAWNPQISVRSLGVIYPIAIGYWESCWPDAMFDTRFFTMIEHLYLIFSRLAYSADVRANALRRVLK